MPAQLDSLSLLVAVALVLSGGSVLFSVCVLVSNGRSAARLSRARSDALAALEEASAVLVDLADKVAGVATVLDRLDGARQQLDQRVQDVVLLAAGLGADGSASDALLTATRNMQEMNQSFGLQYLGIQQEIRQEAREFNLLSNVMKTRHEAAKNAVNNIR